MENENFQEFTIRCVNYLNSFIPDFEKCFVTGGFFPRFYHNMPIRDIDVYVGSDDVFVDFVKEYSKTSGFEKVLESKKYFKFFNTQSGVMIDLIGFHNPRTRGFISNFDFSICRLYSYTSERKTFISHYQTEDFFDIQKMTNIIDFIINFVFICQHNVQYAMHRSNYRKGLKFRK